MRTITTLIVLIGLLSVAPASWAESTVPERPEVYSVSVVGQDYINVTLPATFEVVTNRSVMSFHWQSTPEFKPFASGPVVNHRVEYDDAGRYHHFMEIRQAPTDQGIYLCTEGIDRVEFDSSEADIPNCPLKGRNSFYIRHNRLEVVNSVKPLVQVARQGERIRMRGGLRFVSRENFHLFQSLKLQRKRPGGAWQTIGRKAHRSLNQSAFYTPRYQTAGSRQMRVKGLSRLKRAGYRFRVQLTYRLQRAGSTKTLARGSSYRAVK